MFAALTVLSHTMLSNARCTLLLQFVICSLAVIFLSQAEQYILIPDNDEVLTPCPSDDSFQNSLDLTNMEFTFHGDVIEVGGYASVLWTLDSTDNIEIQMEAFKKTGAKYTPTVLNIFKKDGCGALFNEKEKFYDVLFRHLVEDDQVCVNDHPKVVWHFQSFNLSMVLDGLGGNSEEGEYKVVINVKVYDAKGKFKKERMCCEILGQLEKV